MMIVRGAVLREMGLPAPYASSRPLRGEEVELAPPGPGELLVRIRAAGLCHSDLSVIDGSRPRVMPMLLGHEATGEVIVSEAPGFAPGEEERVFDKFYRGAGAKGRGVGLGLAIARGLVEAHGGRITATNRAQGGATFRFTLPLALPGRAPALVATK